MNVNRLLYLRVGYNTHVRPDSAHNVKLRKLDTRSPTAHVLLLVELGKNANQITAITTDYNGHSGVAA